jgi:hypothetical protein
MTRVVRVVFWLEGVMGWQPAVLVVAVKAIH